MKVCTDFLKNCSVNFSGIRKPYTNSEGVTIYPISLDPDKSDIEIAATTANNSENPMKGYNGEAFWLGEDLVVKKYKGKEAFSNDPMREIEILNKMYDNNLFFDNSQKGVFAFIMPDTTTYLVSTKVNGEEAVYSQVPFTKENLQSLVNIIYQMDTGAEIPDSQFSKKGYSNLCRFMNYDFNPKNIKIEPQKAGVFDFEHSQTENIDDMIEEKIIKKSSGANCHQSDTSPLPSSLRTFEFFTLSKYLLSCDKPNKIFDDYLKLKGDYHEKMSNFYNDFSSVTHFPKIAREISKKEAVHSKLLKKSNLTKYSDIKKSEAIKIQMASFMYEESQYSDTGLVNPKQLQEFTSSSQKYFLESLNKAAANNDKDRIVYYNDCLELFDSWQRINETLKERIKNNDPNILKKLTDKKLTTILDRL